MEVAYTEKAKEHILFWKLSGNLKIQKRIVELVEDTRRHPEEGIGKPERLKYGLAGKWSRRITDKHRMVYAVEDSLLVIHSLKGHYE